MLSEDESYFRTAQVEVVVTPGDCSKCDLRTEN